MANPDSTHTGSPSNDSLYGGSGRDWMRGLAGNDWLSGAGGDDTLEGGDGNDTLIGDAGNDSLVGGAGSDTLNGGAGNDTLIGGGIFDRTNLTDLNFSSFSSATSGVNVNLATGIAQDGLGGTDTLQDINFVQGSGFADTLTGSTSFNLFEQFEGMAGNDTINGGAIDPITGNNGNRVAYHNSTAGVTVNLGTGTASDGFGGTDTLININQVRGSNYADVLTGSDNSAYTEAFEGRAGNDTMDGKGGNDQVRYDNAVSAVNVNLVTGIAQDGQGGTDSLLNIEGIRGSNFNDVLTGGNAANGSGTTDGFEFFQGNGGNDTIDGGAGYDRVDFGSSTSGVNVVLGGAVNGSAQDGLGGTDTLINIEGVRGSDLNDVLTGSDTGGFESFEGRAGNDIINGMGSTDRADYSGDWAAVNVNLATGLALDGFGGTDTLINIEQVRGSAFNDTIAGGAGNDILQGYGGNDTLTGGGGNDTFLFASGGHGVDLITDFGAGDTINVRMAALSTATPTTGNGSTVTGKGIQVLTAAGVTTLYLDTNNVAGAEEQIQLAGVYSASGFTVVNTPEGYTNITYTGTVTSGGDITGTSGNDSLVGGVISDSIIGLDGNDTLIGGNGNDTLLGRAGDDSLSGGAGSDFLSGEAGNDTLDGGAILDRTNYTDLNTVSYITATGGIVMNLQTGVVNDGFGSTDTVSNVNFVTASNQSDSITGSSTFNLFEQFEGLGGNDTINGGAIDTITGSNGNRVEYGASPFAVNVSLLSGTAQDGFGGTDTLININQVRGSNYNDTLTGSDTSLYTESFQGRGGNDTINGMGGNDQVRYDSATTGVTVNLATGVATDGQGGTDTLQSIEGIRGSNFNDSLTGGNPANGSGASDGFEFFEGRAGNDTIDGGTGYDRADYTSSTAGVNVTLGGTGNGTAQDGWGGIDTLTSIEAVRGSEFGDVITGSDSGTFESFEGRAGNDTINGMGGTDRADYSGDWAGVNVNLATGIALDGFSGTDRLANIEQVRGSAFNDTLIGGNGANLLDGRSGDDILDGGFGSDTLTGGAGLDTFFVSAGVGDVDRITDLAAGEQVGLSGGSGFDLNTQVLTGSDASTLSQGRVMVAPVSGGVTRVFLGLDSLPGADVTVDLVGTYAANDFVVAFNQDSVRIQYSPTGVSKTGSAADEWIYGSNYNDTLSGSAGNDSILGYGGNDSLSGGDGDDHLAADGGADTVDGGNGIDMVHYDLPGAMTSAVVVNLQAGTAVSAGVTDTLISIESASGTELADTLTGTAGANNLEGAGGNDLLFGQAVSAGTAGSAYLASATGGDTILGGGGNDTIQGGAGNDVLYGGYNESNNGQIGMGSDTFAFAASGNGLDVVGDFSADDAILVGANIKVGPSTAGNGTTVSGNAIQVSNANGVTTLFIDTNNVSGSDITIQLNGNFDATGFSAKQNGNGTSTITYSPPPLNLVGTAGTDSLVGAEGHDTLSGLDGSDSLNGNGGNDSILGGAGDDYLDGGVGNDTIDGGANGQYGDTIAFAFATTGINVNLATGIISNDGAGGVDAVSNVEHVNGTSFNDTLVGDGLTNWFRPGLGNDSVDGGAGANDVVMYEDASSGISVNLLTGQATGASIGNDTLVGIEAVHGSSFDDTVTLSNVSGYVFGRGGNDSLTGGNGDDNFIGGSGNDTINGGAGSDQADYQNEDSMGGPASLLAGVTVNLATGIAIDNWGQSDTLTSIEFINGSDYGDRLTGGNPANGSGTTDGFEGFRGNGGNDTMDGGAGFDRVYYDRSFGAVNVTLGGTQNGSAQDGAGGTDTLINIEEVRASGFNDVLTGSDTGVFESFEGRAGNDTIDGKGGTDRISYQTSSGGVSVSLVTGSASDGWGGTDTFVNIENVRGSDFNDAIVGDAKDNDLEGRAGNDTLTGGDGQDSLRGGLGDDVLNGGIQRILNGWDATANSSARYDIAYYTDATSGVTVTLGSDGTGGTATGGGIGSDTLIDIEMVIGSVYGDLIRGSNRAVNEIIRGGAGNDTMYGGDAAGTDLGTNFVDYRFGSGGVTVNLASGTATGADGNDVLSGFSGILSGNFNDSLTGDAQDNFIDAGAGNDTIDGAAGLDALSFQNATGGVAASLATGTSSGADGSDTFTNIEGLRGSEFADTLTGDANHNRIQGRDGADVIDGGAGNDTLHGGFGNDTLTGGTGNDLFQYSGGGEGVDRITDFASGDVIAVVAALATGTVVSGTGAGVMAGGIQSSQIAGLTTLYIGTDSIAGADITIELAGTFNASGFSVTTSGGVSQVSYSATNQVITGTAGSDTLLGGVGADTLNGGAGADSLDGGAGVDTASYADATTPVSVILYGGQAFGVSSGNDTLTAIENILGTAYGDLIFGDAADNVLDGGAGNDTLDGALGNDTLLGQTGDDLLNGLAGNDSLDGGDGADSLYGWADSDTLTGGTGTDHLFGGAGADSLDGGADADQLEGDDGADTLLGGAGNDTLRGWNDADSLDGGDGDNALFGGAGADSMQAGTGADQLEGDDGNDTIAGGAGNDTLRGWNDNDSMDGGDGNDALFGGAGADTMMGGTGADQLEGDDGNDSIAGGTGNDTLRGWNDSDNLSGDDGDDLLVGWSGNDAMNGGAGNDQMFGDDGADTLVGGAGGDVLQGGLGNDVYVFATGFGFDGVRDYDYLAGNSDTFQFTGINRTDLSFARVGDALKVERTASAGADVIYVNDWYQAGSNGAYKIETWIMGDTSVFTAAQIEAFV